MAAIVDTVIVQYFLLADAFDLLLDLLGRPVYVPRAVFDPDEPHAASEADASLSEIGRNIRYEERLARSFGVPDEERDRARCNAERLRSLAQHVKPGEVEVADMTDAELALLGRLTSANPDPHLCLLLPLGAGEAACLAIALKRVYVVATDDSDALRALAQLRPDHPYERIRRLLQRAAGEERLFRADANRLHQRMQASGFWDRTLPFPNEWPT
ncbi:MAG: hypothetical protein ACRDYA_14180 [Egibacteraceae bacterium]